MAIQTIFAHVSCSNLEASIAWYSKLFGKPPTRRPMDHLAEWHFTDSAEVQLFEDKKAAGASTLTIGVLPLGEERERLVKAGSSQVRSNRPRTSSSCACATSIRT